METTGLTVIEKVTAGDDTFSVSFAVTSNVVTATVSGVPLMTPVDGFSARPLGRLPVDTDQVSAPVPPVAESVLL